MARVAAVARKELTDMFRDRRTAMVTLLSAIAAGPIFLLLIFNLIASQADRARDLKLPIAGREHAPALAAFLERQQVTLTPAPADYEAQIRGGDLDVVLVVDPQFARDVTEGKPAIVRLVFDRSRDRARPSIDQAEALLRSYNRLWGQQRLALRGCRGQRRRSAAGREHRSRHTAAVGRARAVPRRVLRPVRIGDGRHGGIAGYDRRRARAPIARAAADDARPPGEIVAGKWLAVARSTRSSSLLTLTGFYLTLSFAPLPAVGVPFLFGAREFCRFIVVLLPLILLLPAILLYVGSRARAYKEAQANVSVLLFVVSLLPVVQLFLQRKEPGLDRARAGVGTVFAAQRRAARRGASLGAARIVVAARRACSPIALIAVARRLSRESILSGE
jgi:sodium transport system permease protein